MVMYLLIYHGDCIQDLRDSINYGLYLPPTNGRAGKFLDEERLLQEYPLQGPIGFLEVWHVLSLLKIACSHVYTSILYIY